MAQQKAKLFGIISNDEGKPIEIASVSVQGKPIGVTTGNTGFYLLDLPPNEQHIVVFSFVGFEPQRYNISLGIGEERRIDVKLKLRTHSLRIVQIRDQQSRVEGMQPVDPKQIELLANASGNLEGIIKAIGAASSSNELSSQYSVRGGNFDENLVYVNDFEIYRPFLIRSGQQEGLTFANPDLVSNLKFSAGGFQAKYGDKLSSVLDITYKQPKKFASNVSLGLLGQSVSVEGCSKNKRLTYVAGFRNKTNQILLASQPTKGQYRPVFNDFQIFTTYFVNDKLEFQAIANINQNQFKFQPESAVTSFGLINQTIRLTVYFDGSEVDKFNTQMAGLAAVYRPLKNVKLKFSSSVFQTNENETFDIIGQYYIGEVQTDISKADYNQIKKSLGVGTTQDFARNFLDAYVINLNHSGNAFFKNHTLSWGASIQQENITDRIKEWHRIDSAGYSLPYSNTQVNIYSYVKTNVQLQSLRYQGYIQNAFNFSDTAHFKLVAGVRYHYWNLNKEVFISPRLHFSYLPNWKRDVMFRLGTGIYNQSPFYRELRDLNGNVNTTVKAQKSYHAVAGVDYNLKIWNRPFTLTSEAYYKYMWDVVPYEVDNVRIKYFGSNNAIAYATGVDVRLHGEFVKDAHSWVSLSYLKTKENLTDDYVIEKLNTKHQIINARYSSDEQDKTYLKDTTLYPGWIRRPSDQRINMAIFFSDYIPKHPNLQVHMNLILGTGLPFGPPDHNRYKDTLTIPPYRRVDIGFSAQLFDGSKTKYKHKWQKSIKSIWANLEVFNLLGVTNTVSYLWVKDLYNTTYAVPNYLTARRVNFRLTFKF